MMIVPTIKNIEFNLINSHEKTSSVRDTSLRETLRRALVTRLNNSKHMLLILTETTKNDTDWVPFEISHAIDNCKIPIITVYPNFDNITQPNLLADYWPKSLATRINDGSARVIHIPFKKEPIVDALDQFSINNNTYPTNGLGYYNRETYISWGLLKQ